MLGEQQHADFSCNPTLPTQTEKPFVLPEALTAFANKAD
jgi:hypothetical protein